MRKNKSVKYIIMSMILLFSILIANNSYALEDPDNYSELYKQYLQLSDEEKANVVVIPEKYKVSLNEYNNNTTTLRNSDLPQRYNLAEHYDIKVENQGEEGNCWTFASLETLETYLQMHGYGTFDFSENHLNYVESDLFSETEARREINTGGNYTEFQEYVSKKYGPVNEEDFPYYENEEMQIYKRYYQGELSSLLEVTPSAYVGEYTTFPSIEKENTYYSDEELSNFRNQVKNHIMENGALFTSIIAPSYYSGEFYNNNTYAAYFPYSNDYRFFDHAHTVAIIGWDDNFSKDNFVEENRPTHNGAYIALNSWGKTFGDNGIYYISYDDVYVERQLWGIKEAVTDKSLLKNTKTIKFNDENLYKAIKNSLERKITSYDDSTNTITILSGLINEVDYLELQDSNISDLSGLENFVNLTDLQLENNNISNISPLLSLHKLNSINLNKNKLTTIPNEIKDTALMQLALAYNPIVDFSGLQKAKSITSLNLEGTSITESNLVYLKNLKIVNLNLSNTNIKDYSMLNELETNQTLHVLTINHNNSINYATIPEVTSLDISYSNINEEGFELIPETNKLQYLNISYTNIKDLSVIPVDELQMINISGNKELTNINTLKDIYSIMYNDADLEDISIFAAFTTSELYLMSNNITSYSEIADNENIRALDLTDNKLTSFSYAENMRVFVDENYIRPEVNTPWNVISMKNQKYTDTLYVDTSRENEFPAIENYLRNMYEAGISVEITNGSMDYENGIFEIEDYDKDVVIKILSGNFSGSTITYKIEKLDDSNILYIYVDSSKLNTMLEEGTSIDLSKIKIYAYYDNDSRGEITDYEIEGADNIHVGENVITIKKGNLSDIFAVTGIASDNIIELSFQSKEIYNATLNKIKDMEKERAEFPEYYDNVKFLIDSNDSSKTIKILKEELKNITYLDVNGDELINLDDIKQLKGLMGLNINAKKLEDISALNTIKEYLNERDDLFDYEKYIGLRLRNNEKIQSIDNDIFRSLELSNTKISNINKLKHLNTITYSGNKMIQMDELIDSLRVISINVTEDLDNINVDESGNIILPNIFKTYKDRNFKIEAYIVDQLRDEKYLNPYNKKELEVIESGGNLIINYDDIKDVDYEGKNQFIEITIIDTDYSYMDFEFKYRLTYKIFEALESDIVEPIEIEEDTIPDLSNITIYKVYSNKQKEQITDFEYSKKLITDDMQNIEISYTEMGITKTLKIPINVIEHNHEWSEWKVIKEASKEEEGQKERVCLKNANHKEIAKIDKISEEQYEFIEGAGQTYTEGEEGATFRINADYDLFKNGGKVYVDENFVNSKYYISESGSTIIILTKEYMNSLSEGEHTLKVAFNDGKYAITKFNIDKSNNTSSPKTSDNIENYFYIILISVISFSVILILYKKR